MEGKGAATLPKDQLYSNNFDHGTKVALVAQKVNPEINIIFIRIVQRTEDGLIGYYSDPELIMSINWIIKIKKNLTLFQCHILMAMEFKNFLIIKQTIVQHIQQLHCLKIKLIN